MNGMSYDKLIEAASKKLGTSPEQLRKTLENGDMKALSQSLSQSDKEKLRAILANKELMQKLKSASSPEDVMRIIGK
ncbi:MAG: hypothetical protein J1F04_02320 [Oscillospiraceae bacterium]|nr:hypothetical protein [Oscillospiraceae bacterium]